MKVGELRDLLSNYHDNMDVTISVSVDAEALEIRSVYEVDDFVCVEA